MKTPSLNTLFVSLGILALTILCSCGPAPQPSGQQAKSAPSTNALKSPKFQNFIAPVITSDGRKITIRGESENQVKPGLLNLVKLILETFRIDGTPEMVVRAPQCFWDIKSNILYSSGAISVNTLDQKFTIDGEGFTWKSATSQLTISNHTHALIRRTLLEGTNVTVASAETQPENIDVTSQHFSYDSESAKFSQTVLVKDPSGQITSEFLTVHFAGNPTNKSQIQKIEAEDNVSIDSKGTRAHAGKAVYDMVNQTIQLTDHPVWKSEENDGRSDVLTINRQNNALHAVGNVDMKVLTRSLIGTNSPVMSSRTNATNMAILNIKAADFTRTTNLTVFEGHVRAAQNDATLNCERLTLTVPGPSRQITEVLAERSVLVRRGDTQAAADSAIFDIPTDTITLKSAIGDPPMRWNVGEMKGRSSLLVLHPNTDEFNASGALLVELPERKMSATAPTTTTNRAITITADLLAGTKTRGTFTNNVEVKDADGIMRSTLLTINSGASNQVETILAERTVSIQRGDLIATGQKALYTSARNQIELTGSPRITDPRAKVSAEAFLLNTTNNSFRTRGEYKIEVGDLSALKKSK